MKGWHMMALVGVMAGGAALVVSFLAPGSKPKDRPANGGDSEAVSTTPPPQQVIVVRPQVALDPPASPAVSSPPYGPPPSTTKEEAAARLELSFQRETRTTAGRSLEQTVTAEFNGPDIRGAHLHEVECRDTRCRLDVTFDDLDADREVIGRVFMSAESKMNTGFVVAKREQRPNGSRRATIYMCPKTCSEPSMAQ